MLILITTKCHENCSHCMHDARRDGIDMSLQTLAHVMDYARTVSPILIQISGGEPTLHLQFNRIVDEVAYTFPFTNVLIESNGSFIFDAARRTAVEKALTIRNVHLQVRTHQQYYPNYAQIIKNKELKKLPKTTVHEDNILISPLGRAHGVKTNRKYASCTNLFLLHQQRPNLSVTELNKLLEAHGKLCTPMIDPQGILHTGESIFCVKLGHVTAPNDISKVAPCNKCGLETTPKIV